MRSLEELEQLTGYRFKNLNLLKLAVTHPSMRYEQAYGSDNQRLEFLGDAVVQLLMSERLYHLMPNMDEGGLTQTRSSVVSTKSMADIARFHGLGGFLKLGRSEEINGGRTRDAALADVLEAVIGAIYVDGGIENARRVVEFFFSNQIQRVKTTAALSDFNPKGRLQEIIQDHSSSLPTYKITHESGPDHKKHFLATVTWNGHLLGEGTGPSKKEAETDAANAAIQNPILMKLILRTAGTRND